MSKIKMFGRIVLYLYSFGVFGLMCLVFLPFALFFCMLPASLRPKVQPLVRRITHKGFVFVRWHCHITGFATMRLIDHRESEKSPLLIANHLTMFDIVLLFSYVPEIQTLVNAKFALNPLLRPTIKACGYIPVEVDSPADGVRAFEELQDSLNRGQVLALFPEGTRSQTGKLGALKKGPFRLAVDQGLIPSFVFFTCNQPFLNRAAFFPRLAGPVVLEAHLFDGPESLRSMNAREQQEVFVQAYTDFTASHFVLPWNRSVT